MTAFPRGMRILIVSTVLSHINHLGDCVMTVGTDDKTTLKVKLLPSHDYAVIGRRIIRLSTLSHS